MERSCRGFKSLHPDQFIGESMKVYTVVYWSPFEEAWDIVGVFDSKEKANVCAAEYDARKAYRWHTQVEEWKVE